MLTNLAVQPALRQTLRLQAAARADANLIVRVPVEVWPCESDGPDPAALAADLLDSDEPRAVAAGVRLPIALAALHQVRRSP